MSSEPEDRSANPGLAKTALIRELVDLSRFTEGILHNLDSGVVAINREDRVTFVNPAAEALLGRPAAELLNQPADRVLMTSGGGSLMASSSSDGAAGEVDLELADGRTIVVDVRLSRREAEGGVVAILTDRTDLKRAEQEARRKERLASLGELSAGVAHEIRNPLAGIGASAQLLKARLGEGDERVRFADLILDEVARLDRIVESMLHFARPPHPALRLGDVGECVRRAVGLVQGEADRHGVRIETAFGPDVPRIWIDGDQMVQVVLNLCQNAIQAMEEGGGLLRVRVHPVSRRPYVRNRAGRRAEDRGRLPQGQIDPLDWVEIEVKDSGHGVSREALDHMFNPFYTTRKRGTGLGLSITQAIIQEHGGMISVRSEPGRGTTVLVDLPEDKRRRSRRSI